MLTIALGILIGFWLIIFTAGIVVGILAMIGKDKVRVEYIDVSTKSKTK